MLQPRLRFKGFNNNWQQGRLKNQVNDIETGKSNHKNLSLVKETNYKVPVLGSRSIIGYSNSYDYKGQFLLIARVGAYAGNTYRYSGKSKITDNTIFIESNNNIFIDGLLNYFDLRKISFGSGRPLVKSSELKNLKLNFPSLSEQRLIGHFFAKLDKLISLQRSKLDLLKKQNRGYLQKLFPRKNKNIPQIRFKRFHDEWDKKSICMMAHVRGGGAFKSKDFTKSGIPVLRISNIQSKSISGNFKFYTPSKSFNKYLLTNGAILIAMSGATVGKIAMLHSNNEFYQNQRVGYFDTNDDTNNYFLYSLLQSDKFFDNLDKIKVSGAQPNISSKDIDDFQFKVPGIKEQQLIGNFFKTLDSNIILQTDKLNHLRKLKKAYLQKMFC